MHDNPQARAKHRLTRMLRPQAVSALTQSAVTWLLPPAIESRDIAMPDHSASSATPESFTVSRKRRRTLTSCSDAFSSREPVSTSLENTIGRLGSLDVRLARDKRDVKQAQRLRYKVFYRDGNAIADAATLLARRDKDAFDSICDHLLVVDHNAKPSLNGSPRVVGTYRLLRHEAALRHGGFYTENEFDIAALLDRHSSLRFLELGRSCVLPRYRNKRTVELLWHGIWTYVRRHRFDVMIGCASFEGTDPDRLALPLSFLHHFAEAPPAWHARAHPSRRIEMNRIAKSAIDPKAALRDLPPLIKGYLRLGAFVGDGAVIDHQFGTTDVLIVLPVSAINARYIEHFGADASRHAA